MSKYDRDLLDFGDFCLNKSHESERDLEDLTDAYVDESFQKIRRQKPTKRQIENGTDE
tara:strand:+ start:727 stop:900 length:174 start_codon:yes stop_codon:yes gene_type:complete